MTTTRNNPARTGASRATVTACACLLASAALADPVVLPASKPREAAPPPLVQATPGLDWAPSAELLGFTPTVRDPVSGAPINVARGNELDDMAAVEMDRTDRRFRARVVDWFSERSYAAGLASDLLLHGSDTGMHLRVRPGSEFLMRWEMRF